jgi:hypothetical protein
MLFKISMLSFGTLVANIFGQLQNKKPNGLG